MNEYIFLISLAIVSSFTVLFGVPQTYHRFERISSVFAENYLFIINYFFIPVIALSNPLPASSPVSLFSAFGQCRARLSAVLSDISPRRVRR